MNNCKRRKDELYEVVDFSTEKVVGNTNQSGLNYFMHYVSSDSPAIDGSELGFPGKLVYVGKKIADNIN